MFCDFPPVEVFPNMRSMRKNTGYVFLFLIVSASIVFGQKKEKTFSQLPEIEPYSSPVGANLFPLHLRRPKSSHLKQIETQSPEIFQRSA